MSVIHGKELILRCLEEVSGLKPAWLGKGSYIPARVHVGESMNKVLDDEPPQLNVSVVRKRSCRGSTTDRKAITRTVPGRAERFSSRQSEMAPEGFKNGPANRKVAFYALAV